MQQHNYPLKVTIDNSVKALNNNYRLSIKFVINLYLGTTTNLFETLSGIKSN
jgi:hypothetical protein